MATQSAHLISFNTTSVDGNTREASEGVSDRIVARMKRLYCGLHGHDVLMQFEKTRVYLRCTSCGHETPGWTLTQAAPKVVFRGDARRHAMVRPHFIGARHPA
jgi:hypothetical protein